MISAPISFLGDKLSKEKAYGSIFSLSTLSEMEVFISKESVNRFSYEFLNISDRNRKVVARKMMVIATY